jgi:predicted nuclease of predicted toxin-antitoxin system
LKLLFDQNLSPALVEALQDLFPGSAHTEALGLGRADDSRIWEHARSGGFTIVSKDADFPERAVLLGSPPKVIWIRRGNCSTADIERMLRDGAVAIEAAAASDIVRYVVLVR